MEKDALSGKLPSRLGSQSGSIILAALAVIAIMALLITAAVAYGAWQRARVVKFVNRVSSRHLAEAGLNRGLWHLGNERGYRTEGQTTATGSDAEFTYSVRSWGGYALIQSSGRAGSAKSSVYAIVGYHPPPIFDKVISLIGPAYPLSLSGSVQLEGDVSLTPAGLTMRMLQDGRIPSDDCIHGNINVIDAESIPSVDMRAVKDFIAGLQTIRDTCASKTDNSILVRSSADATRYCESVHRSEAELVISLDRHSIIEGPAYFFADSRVTISDASTLNLVALVSKRSISVSGTSKLKDCILVAPRVEFSDESRFSGQAFADSAIVVEGSARVSDGSFLCLLGGANREALTGRLDLGSDGEMDCFAMSSAERITSNRSMKTQSMETRITVRKGCKTTGLIWSDGYLEMLGSLRGAAAVHLFYYSVPPATYVNWLADASMSWTPRTREYVLPEVFDEDYGLEYKSVFPVQEDD